MQRFRLSNIPVPDLFPEMPFSGRLGKAKITLRDSGERKTEV